MLGLVTGLILAIGISAGCGGAKENKVTWVESTGTITKSVQGESTYTWTMEIDTDKGKIPVSIPGPGPGEIGKTVKLKYNKDDPKSYQLIEQLIKGI